MTRHESLLWDWIAAAVIALSLCVGGIMLATAMLE